MKLVSLSRGMFAQVDDDDYERVAALPWHATPVITKSRTIWYASLGYYGPAVVDHFDDDGLNNQRNNISVITASKNQSRRRKQLGISSSFKGVSWRTAMGKWGAAIKHNGKQKQLGYFVDECDAATAYNLVAVELFGEFTRLNTPPPSAEVSHERV